MLSFSPHACHTLKGLDITLGHLAQPIYPPCPAQPHHITNVQMAQPVVPVMKIGVSTCEEGVGTIGKLACLECIKAIEAFVRSDEVVPGRSPQGGSIAIAFPTVAEGN